MSTTNFPNPRPLMDSNGRPVMVVVHADHVIDGVNRNDPKFFGSIYLNGIVVLSTTTKPDGTTVITPLAPDKGGTGFDNLTDLAQEVAKLLGIWDATNKVVNVPISKGGTGKTTASAALTALGGASAALFSVAVDTSWTNNANGGYMKTITVSGMKATDRPVVGMNMSGSTVSTLTLQGKAMACVSRITTAANSITLYAFETKPTTAFNIQLLAIRGIPSVN